MRNKICLVTGATSGIGLETARALAVTGATVVLSGRDTERGTAAVASIRQSTGNHAVEFLGADLSSMNQVAALAAEFASRHDHLDVLINNAGSCFLRRSVSPDGIEMTLALNHLAPFLLTNLLLRQGILAQTGRIINVSSNAHRYARIDLGDLEGRKKYKGFGAYAQSKLAQILFTYELARRLGENPTVNAVHPGVVGTDIWTGNVRYLRPFAALVKMFARNPEEGAVTSAYLASSPAISGVTGKYFAGERMVSSSAESHREDIARRLWEISDNMTGRFS